MEESEGRALTFEVGLVEAALGLAVVALVALSFTVPGRKYRGELWAAALALGAFAAGRSTKPKREGIPGEADATLPSPPPAPVSKPPKRDEELLDALESSETIRKETDDEVANTPDPSGLSDSALADAIHGAVADDDTDPAD